MVTRTDKSDPVYKAAYQEGVDARRSGKFFNLHCPYTFERTGEKFDRRKLNGWFEGWYGEQERK